jgi:hypothetical protein
MTAILEALQAFCTAVAQLLWQLFGILPPDPNTGRHRLERVPAHQGYADDISKLAELAAVDREPVA